MLGIGGAVRGLPMAAFKLEKSVFSATLAFIDFFIDFSRTYDYNGFIDKEDLIYVPLLLVIGGGRLVIGKKLLDCIS